MLLPCEQHEYRFVQNRGYQRVRGDNSLRLDLAMAKITYHYAA